MKRHLTEGELLVRMTELLRDEKRARDAGHGFLADSIALDYRAAKQELEAIGHGRVTRDDRVTVGGRHG